MATQPLETIPEEETPTPATTPARVTADPPKTKPATTKNPGRVASGKRLAERNRLAREAKKKAEAEAASATAQPPGNTPAQSEGNNTEASSISLMTMLGRVLPARGYNEEFQTFTSARASTTGSHATGNHTTGIHAGPISHPGKTRYKEDGMMFFNPIHTPRNGP